MPFQRLASACFLLLFAATSLWGRAASADPVLVVEQISGEVEVDQLGETHLLKVGDELHDRDVVHVGYKAYLSLRFTREGALELGPGATLAIERLPGSDTELNDLRSIFSLWQGYMHVVWKHPANTRWPLFLYFGGHRSSMVDGEYFFERVGSRNRSCVAAGRLAVTAISGDGLETLYPSACYEIRPGTQPKAQPRLLDAWVPVRQSFTLDPDPSRPVHAFAEHGTVETAEQVPSAPVAPAVVAAVPAASTPAAALPAPASVASAVSSAPARPAPVPAAAPALPPPAPVAIPVAAPASAPTPAPAPAVAVVPKAPAAASVAVATAAPAPSPSPSSTSAPVASSPAAEAGVAGWTILVGSYSDPVNAEHVEARLQSIGLKPFRRVKDVDGRTWNSVQVRGFASREAAQARLEEASTKLGLPNLRVVLLP